LLTLNYPIAYPLFKLPTHEDVLKDEKSVMKVKSVNWGNCPIGFSELVSLKAHGFCKRLPHPETPFSTNKSTAVLFIGTHTYIRAYVQA
jgi:hypothetical protein